MKILVTGSQGMLGTDVMNMLAGEHQVAGCDVQDCNILHNGAFEALTAVQQPEVIIHTAAYTNVDQAEEEPELARQVNEIGTRNVAQAARAHRARLIAISTDYVFDGRANRPYTEDDPPCPAGVYGRSKLHAEQQIQEIFAASTPSAYLIIRTAWLYGHHGHNFIKAILQRARQQQPLRVVNDQTGTPTYTRDLVWGIAALLKQPKVAGIVHLTNSGQCTWYEFARAILDYAGLTSTPIEAISSVQLDRPAPRPGFSVLDTSKFTTLTGQVPPHWRQGLNAYVNYKL